MSICSSCQSEVTGAFCTNCGTRVGGAPSIASMPLKIKVALLGCALAAIGVFLPMLHAPIVGDVNYFLNGHGDGRYILLAAVIAGIFAYRDITWPSAIAGVLTLALLAWYYSHVQGMLAAAEKSAQNAGIFSGLGEMLVQSIQIEYGFFVILVGGALMLICNVIPTPTTIQEIAPAPSENPV